MLLLIYAILMFAMLINMGLEEIFRNEKEKSKGKIRYIKVLDKFIWIFEKLYVISLRLFEIYCIFIFIYGIFINNWLFCIISASFLISDLLRICENFIYFHDIIKKSSIISIFIWIINSVFIIFVGMFSGTVTDDNAEKIRTIDILEFKQSEYTSIEGGRYYIKSTPSNAYYYEVRTEKGGTTTKTIDGSSNYVEKYEDNKYIKNPHIDVYKVKRYYINWYGFKMKMPESSSYYQYYIYIPEDGTFYER